MPYLFLVLAFTINSAANALLKNAAVRGFKPPSAGLVALVQHNALLLLGMCLFGVNLMFYYLALKSIPLSVAYPIMLVMSLLLITSYSYFFLSEKISTTQVVGYVFVILGIILISVFAKKV